MLCYDSCFWRMVWYIHEEQIDQNCYANMMWVRFYIHLDQAQSSLYSCISDGFSSIAKWSMDCMYQVMRGKHNYPWEQMNIGLSVTNINSYKKINYIYKFNF